MTEIIVFGIVALAAIVEVNMVLYYYNKMIDALKKNKEGGSK